MTFGEKLMDLRKKEGLSQEELGDKLNVTRQTVSKWELNQTKPDMDKLKEISNLFNVSVEDLTSTDTDKVTKKVTSSEAKPRTWLLVVLIIVELVLLVFLIDKGVQIKNKKDKEKGGLFDIIETKFKEIDEDISSSDFDDEFEKTRFNNGLEMYVGTEYGSSVGNLLDKIITNNKKNERKVIVKYNETETSDPTEVKNLKPSFDKWTEYEVSADYDEKGYVYLMTIEDLAKEEKEEKPTTGGNTSGNTSGNSQVQTQKESNEDWFNRSSFNGQFEIIKGSTSGFFVREALNDVIAETNRVITVTFKGTSTSDKNTIKGFIGQISEFNNYNVSLGYDSEKYVNSITIEEV